MRLLSLGFILLTVVFLPACSRAERHDARVRHIWGQTRRGTIPSIQGQTCAPEFSSTPEAIRLNALAARIAAANPEVFSNQLDLSRLCIGVDPKLQAVDARTTPEIRRVAFSRPLYALAKNDGELAAVLSHELAHITLQHSGFSEFPPRMNGDPEFDHLKADAKIIQNQIVELAKAKAEPAKIFALNEQFAKLLTRMNQRIDEIYGEANAHLNWIEQEADEVGAEFFIRAGFSKQDFIDILWSSHPTDAADRTACEQMIDNSLQDDQTNIRPDRGNRTHPTTCWRVFHLKIDEWAHAHRKEIGTLKPD